MAKSPCSGLIGEQPGDDRLRAIAFELQAAEAGLPVAVQEALDADFVVHAVSSHPVPFVRVVVVRCTLRAVAVAGRHPTVHRQVESCACRLRTKVPTAGGISLTEGNQGSTMATSRDRPEGRWLG